MNLSLVNQVKLYCKQSFECICWISALVLLFCWNTGADAPSLCIFKWIGFSHCPGCGLGHAVRYALHLQFRSSFQQHPMGIVAVLIILNRIKQLSFKPKFTMQ